ncbi:MAG: rane protein [Candidatus Saccharibacteria bacterium]|nr:rane protein [Candidatus Saccharibacteria bacterium]
MRKLRFLIIGGVTVSMLIGALIFTGHLAAATASKKVTVNLSELQTLSASVTAIKAPVIESPQWLKDQDAAAAAAATRPLSGIVTYSVTTKGTITADFAEFRQQANATLNDARGWARLGIRFQEVASGGNFTLVLSEASQVPSFSSGCGAEYSCRAGRYVIINQDRWTGATPSWNNAGGSLRDYRHMVVNHETGHWLGHDHQSCGGAGQPAPVMQQQSIDLQGCGFNAWPLASELWSTQLGINKR